jgi:carboxyl-terminal processing protease
VPPAVTARVATDGIGLVRIAGFTNDTPTALREAIGRVQRDGARAVVVDLRSCAGGPLAAGVEAARLFIGTGTIGQLETKGATRQTVAAREGDGAVALPLALLVDGGTGGPAELFAAAVSGHKRGELLGERTAGRVAVQRVFPLPDGSALWMSYAYYLTTAGEPIHDRGVQPDIVIEQPDPEFGAPPAPGDPTLDRAIERLRARSAS